jgi:hypothetical protein
MQLRGLWLEGRLRFAGEGRRPGALVDATLLRQQATDRGVDAAPRELAAMTVFGSPSAEVQLAPGLNP